MRCRRKRWRATPLQSAACRRSENKRGGWAGQGVRARQGKATTCVVSWPGQKCSLSRPQQRQTHAHARRAAATTAAKTAAHLMRTHLHGVVGHLHDIDLAAGCPRSVPPAAAAGGRAALLGQQPEGGPQPQALGHLDARLDAYGAGCGGHHSELAGGAHAGRGEGLAADGAGGGIVDGLQHQVSILHPQVLWQVGVPLPLVVAPAAQAVLAAIGNLGVPFGGAQRGASKFVAP